MATYVVVALHNWNIKLFNRLSVSLDGSWLLIDRLDDLTPERLDTLAPRYVFFPHWSAKVPEEIISRHECVCFHMTDVPYGRGGSPLQNLIARGHRSTKLTALRMVADLDAGPVYQKRSVLLDGTAQAIYERVALLVWDMIGDIVAQEPQPIPQTGQAVIFKRRRPSQSELSPDADLEQVYNHIRMLDADGYPHAFIETGQWHLSFRNAHLKNNGTLEAKVTFTPRKP